MDVMSCFTWPSHTALTTDHEAFAADAAARLPRIHAATSVRLRSWENDVKTRNFAATCRLDHGAN